MRIKAKTDINKLDTRKIFTYTLIVAIIVFALFSKGLRSIFFVLLFIVGNVFATLYKRYFYLPVEFEIISMGIVLCAHSYGLGAGLAVALVGGIAYTIFCTSFSPFTIPMLAGYGLMAVISSYVPINDIFLLGITANIVHNFFVFSIYHFAFAYDPMKNIVYSVSNIIFNMFLFWNLAPLLIKIM